MTKLTTMHQHHGDNKGTTRGQNMIDYQIRPWPGSSDTRSAIRERVMDLLSRPAHFYRGPGTPWWSLRQGLTGRVPASPLREVLDQLLEDGLAVETWLQPPSRRQVAHRFILVEDWPVEWGGYKLLRIRGNPDVIERLEITLDDHF